MFASVSGSWPAESATVPAARRLVREHLASQGRPELGDDAQLLVSELVGNVVLHVGGMVTVTVRTGPDEVMLEVTDASPVAPQLRLFSRTASTGRGMRLVHSLSADHGVAAQADGKTVWVRLSAATAARSDAKLAASFADVDWLAELESELDDGADGAADAPARSAA